MILASEFEDHAIFEEAGEGLAFDFEARLAEYLGLFGVFYRLACGDIRGFGIRHLVELVPRCGDLKKMGGILSIPTFCRYAAIEYSNYFLLLRTFCRYAAQKIQLAFRCLEHFAAMRLLHTYQFSYFSYLS